MIHVIGDSHVLLFYNLLPDFQIHHLGSFLAYSLGEPNHEVNTKLREVIESTEGPVLLSFGEVDCRAHLVKRYAANGPAPVVKAVERYCDAIEWIAKERQTALWAVPPSSPFDDPERQSYFARIGTQAERQHVTNLFNASLKRYAPCPVIDISEHLSDPIWHEDKVHLHGRFQGVAKEKVWSVLT